MWGMFGRPTRSVEEQHFIVAECSRCEHLDGNTCGICGCDVRFGSAKLAWGTTRCPDSPPRWGEVAELAQCIGLVRGLAGRDPEKKTNGRGCGGCGKSKRT